MGCAKDESGMVRGKKSEWQDLMTIDHGKETREENRCQRETPSIEVIEQNWDIEEEKNMRQDQTTFDFNWSGRVQGKNPPREKLQVGMMLQEYFQTKMIFWTKDRVGIDFLF